MQQGCRVERSALRKELKQRKSVPSPREPGSSGCWERDPNPKARPGFGVMVDLRRLVG